MEDESSSVSFTTANGKEVAFKAKKGKAKASAKKKVIETPVTPQETEEPVEPAPVESAPVEPVPVEPAHVAPEPVEPAPVAPEPKKPARKAKAKATPGIPEQLPKKTKIERPAELPAPEALVPPPPELQRFSREDMHSMIHDYMQTNKRNNRDARINMYRSWLTA